MSNEVESMTASLRNIIKTLGEEEENQSRVWEGGIGEFGGLAAVERAAFVVLDRGS